MRRLTYRAAVLEAITQSMDLDPSIRVIGDSVADPAGTRGATGLVEKFGPGRVIRTPLSEEGMTGVAVGMAMRGLRPLQVHIRCDFTLLAANQLVNMAAKIRYMYGGRSGGVPLTVWTSIGRSWGQGPQHSQNFAGFFASVPGLRVVMPSTPQDAKDAMAWCLTRSPDPVLFIDHRMLHKIEDDVRESHEPSHGDDWGSQQAVGNDLTIVAFSYMNTEARRAVEHLKTLGVSCSLIDPRWLRPFPAATIIASDCTVTRRLLVVDCGHPKLGPAAEVVAVVSEILGGGSRPLLDALRMGFAETVCPTSHALEADYYPTARSIAEKAYYMVRGEPMPQWNGSAAPEQEEFRGPF